MDLGELGRQQNLWVVWKYRQWHQKQRLCHENTYKPAIRNESDLCSTSSSDTFSSWLTRGLAVAWRKVWTKRSRRTNMVDDEIRTAPTDAGCSVFYLCSGGPAYAYAVLELTLRNSSPLVTLGRSNQDTLTQEEKSNYCSALDYL